MKAIDYNQIILDIDGKPLCFPNGNPMALGQVLITACARSADDDNLLSPEKVQNIGRIALKVHHGEDLRLSEVEAMEARLCAVFPPLLALLVVAALKGENLGIVPAVPPAPAAPDDTEDHDDGGDEAQELAVLKAAPVSTDTQAATVQAPAVPAADAAPAAGTSIDAQAGTTPAPDVTPAAPTAPAAADATATTDTSAAASSTTDATLATTTASN
jgi:hypothetical protein